MGERVQGGERIKALIRGPEGSVRRKLVVALRGDKKSVLRRFYYDPKEQLSCAMKRMRGASWISFYAERLDRFGGEQTLEGVKPNYLADGASHLEYLQRHGLQPHYSVFDFGCGFGRTARYLVEYLEPGNYVGADISKERLRLARELMRRHGLESQHPTFLLNVDNTLAWLGGRRFDFIWAQSVFNHMPDEDVREFFAHLGNIMHTHSVLLLTPVETQGDVRTKRASVKDWFRSYPLYQRFCAQFGFHAELWDGADLQQPRFKSQAVLRVMKQAMPEAVEVGGKESARHLG